MIKQYYPHSLATVFLIVFIWLGISPVSRAVWIAEVIPVFVVYILLVITYSKYKFSNIAYSLMAIWLFWHTIGGHYTFSNVPFGLVNDLLGSDRNHFDRIGHFVIGLYAFPMAEWLLRKGMCKITLASFFSLFLIMSVAAGYEIIEWLYAITEGGDAGIEFLGSQGDIWDAQKDMLADTLGAIFSLILFWIIRTDKN